MKSKRYIYALLCTSISVISIPESFSTSVSSTIQENPEKSDLNNYSDIDRLCQWYQNENKQFTLYLYNSTKLLSYDDWFNSDILKFDEYFDMMFKNIPHSAKSVDDIVSNTKSFIKQLETEWNDLYRKIKYPRDEVNKQIDTLSKHFRHDIADIQNKITINTLRAKIETVKKQVKGSIAKSIGSINNLQVRIDTLQQHLAHVISYISQQLNIRSIQYDRNESKESVQKTLQQYYADYVVEINNILNINKIPQINDKLLTLFDNYLNWTQKR